MIRLLPGSYLQLLNLLINIADDSEDFQNLVSISLLISIEIIV